MSSNTEIEMKPKSDRRLSIKHRGYSRFLLNTVRTARSPEIAMLDSLSDIHEWLVRAMPQYRHSWTVKAKAQGIREYLRAVYILTQEFFEDCEQENIKFQFDLSSAEKVIEGLGEPYKFDKAINQND